MKVYTLPVIDDDGYVTGERDTLLVASRELEVKSCPLEQLEVGEARLCQNETSHHIYYLPNDMVFSRQNVSIMPNPDGRLTHVPQSFRRVWVRIE